MAHLPRLSLPSILQHVIQCGNNRQACFYAGNDHRFYLEFLGEAARKYRVSIHAYVLMTNHVHVLMTPTSARGIGRSCKPLAGAMSGISTKRTAGAERCGRVDIMPAWYRVSGISSPATGTLH
jgi:REP element-mobilizing transposase RayT